METLQPMGGCMGGVDVCGWVAHACTYTCQFKLQMAVSPNHPPIHPPIGGGVSTDHKSSNRIELF